MFILGSANFCAYDVVQFYTWFKISILFSLFLDKVMYDKIEPQHTHL